MLNVEAELLSGPVGEMMFSTTTLSTVGLGLGIGLGLGLGLWLWLGLGLGLGLVLGSGQLWDWTLEQHAVDEELLERIKDSTRRDCWV